MSEKTVKILFRITERRDAPDPITVLIRTPLAPERASGLLTSTGCVELAIVARPAKTESSTNYERDIYNNSKSEISSTYD